MYRFCISICLKLCNLQLYEPNSMICDTGSSVLSFLMNQRDDHLSDSLNSHKIYLIVFFSHFSLPCLVAICICTLQVIGLASEGIDNWGHVSFQNSITKPTKTKENWKKHSTWNFRIISVDQNWPLTLYCFQLIWLYSLANLTVLLSLSRGWVLSCLSFFKHRTKTTCLHTWMCGMYAC